MNGLDAWTCGKCGWRYEGPCVPHKPFGWNVEQVGAHMWNEHADAGWSAKSGKWQHIEWAPPTGPRVDDPFGFLEG